VTKFKKMPNNKKRKIDKITKDVYGVWNRNIVLMKKSKIRLWQATFVVVFILGSFMGFFLLIRTNKQTSSKAADLSVTQKLEIQKISDAINQSGAGWTAGETSISILTPEERKRRLGVNLNNVNRAEKPNLAQAIPATALATTIPTKLDWRNYNNKNFVTPVKNQGSCGSCWAFADTANAESATLIKAGTSYSQNPIDFSEQIVLSCSNSGSCEGGLPEEAGNFLVFSGTNNESCFPYSATDSACISACQNWQETATKIDNQLNGIMFQPYDVTQLKKIIYKYGPVVVTFLVYSDFSYYTKGVYRNVWGSFEGGHAVQVVGYDDANQCFIAKNSWGPYWGEGGYFRIAYSEFSGNSKFGKDNAYTYNTDYWSVSGTIANAKSNLGINIDTGPSPAFKNSFVLYGVANGSHTLHITSQPVGQKCVFSFPMMATGTINQPVTVNGSNAEGINIVCKNKYSVSGTITNAKSNLGIRIDNGTVYSVKDWFNFPAVLEGEHTIYITSQPAGQACRFSFPMSGGGTKAAITVNANLAGADINCP